MLWYQEGDRGCLCHADSFQGLGFRAAQGARLH